MQVENILERDPGYKSGDAIAQEQIINYAIYAQSVRPGIKPVEVFDYYSNWTNYEKECPPNAYRGPQIAADMSNIVVWNKNAKILDIGAGTGLVCELLARHGFKNFDGIEPSDLCDVARSKNIYKQLWKDCIYADKQTPIENDSYDLVVSAGSFGEGHIPAEGVYEFARLCKPGGHVVIVMREEYLSYVKEYVNRLEPTMIKMEKEEKIWRQVTRLVMENYAFGKSGIAFVYQKL